MELPVNERTILLHKCNILKWITSNRFVYQNFIVVQSIDISVFLCLNYVKKILRRLKKRLFVWNIFVTEIQCSQQILGGFDDEKDD